MAYYCTAIQASVKRLWELNSYSLVRSYLNTLGTKKRFLANNFASKVCNKGSDWEILEDVPKLLP